MSVYTHNNIRILNKNLDTEPFDILAASNLLIYIFDILTLRIKMLNFMER